ncbi:MAG: hypothetical protein WCU90_09700 [Kiritimatiellia bacterium]
MRDRFFAPVHKALAEPDAGTRKCPSLSDRDHILSGIGRVMGTGRSGCGWEQHMQMDWGAAVSVCGFFDSLKSARRLALVEDIATHVRLQADRQCAGMGADPLAEHPGLKGFAVYASDGHYEKAAAHTPPVGGEIQPQGFFYSVNLRTHSMGLLDIARPSVKKEHDMHALKRLTAKSLRMGEKEGVHDEKVEAKRAKRQALAERIAAEAGRRPNPLVAGCASVENHTPFQAVYVW